MHRDDAGPLSERVIGLIADYLSVGIDPERSPIFTHSAVPALNQLMLPFLSLVTDSELRRNPTVKAEFEASGGRPMSGLRSEEHTSELQSRGHLVCRLLLEKKKTEDDSNNTRRI